MWMVVDSPEFFTRGTVQPHRSKKLHYAKFDIQLLGIIIEKENKNSYEIN